MKTGSSRGADEGGLRVTGEEASTVLDAGQFLSKQRLHLQHTTAPAGAYCGKKVKRGEERGVERKGRGCRSRRVKFCRLTSTEARRPIRDGDE